MDSFASSSRPRSARRLVRGLTVVGLGLLIGLLAGEAVVRIFDPDWRYMRRLPYYNSVGLEFHEPVYDDPLLSYRITPGPATYAEGEVTINSLGFRGAERTIRKPSGTFRILVLGASNVFGVRQYDDETWPARLEQTLNAAGPGRFEVFNAGVPAYVPCQMTAAGRADVERFDFDLVILALSNTGEVPMLQDRPIRPYFERDPELFTRFVGARSLATPSWLPERVRRFLFLRSRLYRMIVLARMEWTGDRPQPAVGAEERNRRCVQEFAAWTTGRVPLAVFICPGCRQRLDRNLAYIDGLDLPVFLLDAPPDASENTRDIHPRGPETFVWYADEIARWLRENGLVPPAAPGDQHG